jgi:hypothetical protein
MLTPLDVAVLLHLKLHPDDAYAVIAAKLGIGRSTAHASVARLVRSGLAFASRRSTAVVAAGPMREFLVHGVPYAFAPDTVPRARGVVSGFRALPDVMQRELLDPLPLVWPSPLGEDTGIGVEPLVPGAPDLRHRDPKLYRLLALIDSLRLADAREREVARRALDEELQSIAS